MALEYKKQTDKEHKETLESKIVHAIWGQKVASAGDKVKFFVQTHLVGSGSDIEIKVDDKDGKAVAQLAGKVFGDYFAKSLTVPEGVRESLVFTAKLTKHGLEKKSSVMQVIPPVKVTNLKWGQKEARRGDVVKLTADIQGVPDGIEVWIRIFEYDQDGAHDFITKFPCLVKNKKIETQWEYEYHEDTDEIPTDIEMQRYGSTYNPPEYFFVVDVYNKRFGTNQESGLLEFRDWIEFFVTNGPVKPFPNIKYVIYLPDGNKREGKLDDSGYARENTVPPGNVYIEFPQLFYIESLTEDEYSIHDHLHHNSLYYGDKDNEQINVATDEQSEKEVDIGEIDSNEEEKDIEQVDENNNLEEVSGGGEELPDYTEPIKDPMDHRSDREDTAERQLRSEWKSPGLFRVTGRSFHFYVNNWISIRLLNKQDHALPFIEYELQDEVGNTLFFGESDEKGDIVCKGVGIEYFHLIIGKNRFTIMSVPQPSEREYIYIDQKDE